MQHVTIIFENPISNTPHHLSEKCHSLTSDLDKFVLAKVDSNDDVQFLSNCLNFKPIQDLTDLMFDNRFELFADTYAAELTLRNVNQHHPSEPTPSYYLYQVSLLNRTNDTLTLNVIKKF